MMQLLSLVAMEPPVSLSASAIRDEKVKVLQSIRPLNQEDFEHSVIRTPHPNRAVLPGIGRNATRSAERDAIIGIAERDTFDTLCKGGASSFSRTPRKKESLSAIIVIQE